MWSLFLVVAIVAVGLNEAKGVLVTTLCHDAGRRTGFNGDNNAANGRLGENFNVASAELCQAACAANSECAWFTFATNMDEGEANCKLRRTVPTADLRGFRNFVSGPADCCEPAFAKFSSGTCFTDDSLIGTWGILAPGLGNGFTTDLSGSAMQTTGGTLTAPLLTDVVDCDEGASEQPGQVVLTTSGTTMTAAFSVDSGSFVTDVSLHIGDDSDGPGVRHSDARPYRVVDPTRFALRAEDLELGTLEHTLEGQFNPAAGALWVVAHARVCRGTLRPTSSPTEAPTTMSPTPAPTPAPTDEPTREPTPAPTDAPNTPQPTMSPNTPQPTPEPTDEPTLAPTDEPTPAPTDEPTPQPTDEPTPQPTPEPTDEPTPAPTDEPTPAPTLNPTEAPTIAQTGRVVAVIDKTYTSNENTKVRTCSQLFNTLALVLPDREVEMALATVDQSTLTWELSFGDMATPAASQKAFTKDVNDIRFGIESDRTSLKKVFEVAGDAARDSTFDSFLVYCSDGKATKKLKKKARKEFAKLKDKKNRPLVLAVSPGEDGRDKDYQKISDMVWTKGEDGGKVMTDIVDEIVHFILPPAPEDLLPNPCSPQSGKNGGNKDSCVGVRRSSQGSQIGRQYKKICRWAKSGKKCLVTDKYSLIYQSP